MMESAETKQPETESKKGVDRADYEAPAIVYESIITTRAGSPAGATDGAGTGVDPADLFGG